MDMSALPSKARAIQWNQESESAGLTNIDKLFNRFEGIYKRKWASDFPNAQSVENWKEAWSEGLDGLSNDHIRRGLNGCIKLDWPPSLPEFRKLCLGEHQVNYEQMFHEAAKLTAQQAHGVKVQWPSALIYWSAEAFGWDEIRFATWMNCQRKWTEIVNEMLQEEVLPPVPAHEALPAPGKTTVTAEAVHQRIQEFTATKMVGARTEEKNEWGISPSHHLMTVHQFPKFNASIAVAAMRRLRWPEGKIQRFVIEVWGMKDQVYIAKLLGHELE